jgi:hypothetical protein
VAFLSEWEASSAFKGPEDLLRMLNDMLQLEQWRAGHEPTVPLGIVFTLRFLSYLEGALSSGGLPTAAYMINSGLTAACRKLRYRLLSLLNLPAEPWTEGYNLALAGYASGCANYLHYLRDDDAVGDKIWLDRGGSSSSYFAQVRQMRTIGSWHYRKALLWQRSDVSWIPCLVVVPRVAHEWAETLEDYPHCAVNQDWDLDHEAQAITPAHNTPAHAQPAWAAAGMPRASRSAISLSRSTTGCIASVILSIALVIFLVLLTLFIRLLISFVPAI